jgi:hypothetical protein
MPLIHEVSAAEFIRMGLVLEEKQYAHRSESSFIV